MYLIPHIINVIISTTPIAVISAGIWQMWIHLQLQLQHCCFVHNFIDGSMVIIIHYNFIIVDLQQILTKSHDLMKNNQ